MKICESKIKALPGTVGLFDPIPLDKLFLIEEILSERELIRGKDIPAARRAEMHGEFFRAIFSCVEEWKLDGLPANVTLEDLRAGGKFKRNITVQLESWLTEEVLALYYAEQSNPNE